MKQTRPLHYAKGQAPPDYTIIAYNWLRGHTINTIIAYNWLRGQVSTVDTAQIDIRCW